MICKKCGSVISDDAKFCNFCGEAQEVGMPVETTQSVIDQQNYVAPDAPVEYQQMPQVEPAPIFEQPVAEEPAPVFEMPVQQEQPVYAEAPSKNNGKGLAITSLVLGIVGLVCAIGGICCCGTLSGLLSIVTAIVGLILASVAKKKGFVGGIAKAGFILNIISLIISIILLVISVIIVIIALVGGGGMEEIFGEFFEAFEEGYNAGYDASAKSYSDSIYSDYYAVKSVISSFLK